MDKGPDYWIRAFDKCGGRSQSPINIEPKFARFNPRLKNFVFHNYELLISWNVENNGHSSTFSVFKINFIIK